MKAIIKSFVIVFVTAVTIFSQGFKVKASGEQTFSFTDKYGTAPSIMDYARFNYVAQPGDEGVALMPNIGVYDKYAIEWGYRPILEAKTPDEEKKTLDSWILKHEGDPM